MSIISLSAVTLTTQFLYHSGFVDMLVNHVPSPLDAAARKVAHCYKGTSGALHEDMIACDQSGRLVAHTTKMYPTDDCSFFLVSDHTI